MAYKPIKTDFLSRKCGTKLIRYKYKLLEKLPNRSVCKTGRRNKSAIYKFENKIRNACKDTSYVRRLIGAICYYDSAADPAFQK